MKRELAEKIAGEICISNEPGQTIRKWREEFSISQLELARFLKISPSIISDYESGRRKSPGVQTIRKIVNALLKIDEQRGSTVIKRYTLMDRHEAIFSIREFPIGVPCNRFIEFIEGEVVACPEKLDRDLYGYTVIDSVRAITSLSAFDYLKVYGWSSERALVFTVVKYGRSPMVAIRSHPMKPGMVVFHQPEQVDELAIRLAEIEGIPLVKTKLELDSLITNLEKI
jgi:putative transcriptional regulator